MKSIRLKHFIIAVLLVNLMILACSCSTTNSLNSDTHIKTTLIKLKTRQGVVQPILLLRPENPIGSVVLFAGGVGTLKLSNFFGKPTINWGENIFLVRTRENFANKGFIVALVDVPSDIIDEAGLLSWPNWPMEKEPFRMSNKHSQDIKAVVEYLKQEFNVPVWLIGTSWGTVSATNCAIRLNDEINGLILTSSMTKSPDKAKRWKEIYPNLILDMELSKNISADINSCP